MNTRITGFAASLLVVALSGCATAELSRVGASQDRREAAASEELASLQDEQVVLDRSLERANAKVLDQETTLPGLRASARKANADAASARLQVKTANTENERLRAEYDGVRNEMLAVQADQRILKAGGTATTGRSDAELRQELAALNRKATVLQSQIKARLKSS